MTLINLGALGAGGLTIVGNGPYAQVGRAVSRAGDVNGDGIVDFLFSVAYTNDGFAPGGATLVFGQVGGLGAIDLSSLAPDDGIFIQGTGNLTGEALSSAGDINGDGFDDILIAEPRHDNYHGRAFVLFGGEDGVADADLESLDPDAGFIVSSNAYRAWTALSLSSAGDVNGDGFDDIAIGSSVGRSYVVFGKSGGFGDLDLDALAAPDGFTVHGTASDSYMAVSSAGDFNNDGLDDLLVSDFSSRQVYVIFGQNDGLSDIDLTNFAAGDGYVIQDSTQNLYIAYDVSSAGDINGDGFDDVVVIPSSGPVFVVFGRSGGSQTIDLDALDAGFAVEGFVSTRSATSAGDVNGDGFDDLIVGDPSGANGFGAAYVIFGKASGFATVDVALLSDDDGFVLQGKAASDLAGFDVASAGDANGDGFADILVSAPNNDDDGSYSESVYLVYGVAPTTAVTRIGSAADQTILGGAFDDTLNGAGGADTLIGGAGNDTYFVDNVNDRIVEAAGQGSDLVISSVSHVLDAEVENVDLTGASSIDGTGNDLANVITGNDAANNLAGGAGDDVLTGGGGGDALHGGGGDDELVGGDGVDRMYGEGGDDLLYFGAGLTASALADGGTEYDTLELQGDYSAGLTLSSANFVSIETLFLYGTDTSSTAVSYNLTLADSAIEAGIALYVDGNALTSTGSLHFDASAETDGSVHVFGGAAVDTLIGGAGSDFLLGGPGSDLLRGGAGDDNYQVLDEPDVIEEFANQGTDQVLTDLSTYSLVGTNLENIIGLAGANQIFTGNAAANVIDGGIGADTMRGGLGNDTYFVDNASDLVEENANSGVDGVCTSLASYTLGTSLENLAGLGAASQSLTGNALANLIDGGAGGDMMKGLGGNDTYVVDSGLDVVVEAGGGGTDSVNSTVSHGLSAEVENLTLTGAAAINGTGNGLANILTGNAAANRLDGGLGADTMKGGLGDDIYVVDQAGDVVSELAGQGTDTVQSAIGYTLAAALENLALTGSANINGTGNIFANILVGNSGANLLNGGAGADVMNGGLGNDTYIVDNSADQVFETSASGGFDVVQASASVTIGSNIEQLILTGANAINGTGNALANTLTGNNAANILDGGAGADTMQGNGGNDTYVIDNVGDVVVETAGGGTDTIQTSSNHVLAAELENLTLTGTGNASGTGNAVVNVLIGNSGANRLDGGAGADTMAGGLGNDSYVVDNGLDKVIEVGGGGTDTVNASITHQLAAEVENLILTGAAAINGFGNGLANTLTGNNAANRLDGGLGADTLKGGLGDDVYVVNEAGDVVSELAGQGTDRVESAVSYTLGAAVENLTLTGTGNLNGTGNLFANVLIGTSGANRLDGGGGADTMNGGLGNDTYVVDNDGDVVIESSATGGTDTVESSVTFILGPTLENLILTGASDANGTGNALANTLIGNDAVNILNGGAGNDALQGGAGNDTLIGSVGADTLDGGTGADQFTFLDTPVEDDADHILSFEVGSDIIVLDDAAFTMLPVGALAVDALVMGTAAADADDRILYDAATGNLFYDSDGTGATAAILFATLDNQPATLAAGDFLVI